MQGVSLAGRPGERIVLMGPNGSGKTTLLRILATELACSFGSLEIFGVPPGVNKLTVRRRMGFARDQPIHMESLTGRENAELFAELYGLKNRDAKSRLDSLFLSFGLSDVENIPVRSYSHGMKKKLQLLESFAHDPELIILDEPTLGLDPLGLEVFVDLLNQEQTRDRCVVVATNNPEVAMRVATSVVFLMDGAVVTRGSPEKLLEQLADETKVEIRTSGNMQGDIDFEIEGMVPEILPGKVLVNMPANAGSLPVLMAGVLDAGLEISKIEITRPDLSDVFLLLTGRALEEDVSGEEGS